MKLFRLFRRANDNTTLRTLEEGIPRTFFQELPEELRLKIFSYLQITDLKAARSTCQSWKDVLEGSLVRKKQPFVASPIHGGASDVPRLPRNTSYDGFPTVCACSFAIFVIVFGSIFATGQMDYLMFTITMGIELLLIAGCIGHCIYVSKYDAKHPPPDQTKPIVLGAPIA
eukprot:TRINITY_DN23010_c0_g1_i1.p1 TRINITY_DN23010_c0_g1~~TRINITY_DN23010_c0_g1_i1.p1  ORF type:complete len:171 (-),score=8.13 TRINITY_DN23010_c0_g1_i1:33-545(-)